MTEDNYDTLRIHAGYDAEKHQFAASVPIYETAAFLLGNTENAKKIVSGKNKDRFSYSRVGNPTVSVFEKRMAVLEGGVDAVAVGSGRSAIAYSLLNIAEGGGRIITPTNFHESDLDELGELFSKFHINFDFCDQVNDFQSIRKLICEDTKAIYVESVSNPTTEVADIENLATIAHAAKIPLIVNNTLPTSYLLKPFNFGADIVVYSSTKGINGHNNSNSGLIIDRGELKSFHH